MDRGFCNTNLQITLNLEKEELNILRKLQGGGVDAGYLMDIYDRYRDNYRIRLSLIQHPGFPVDTALNVISSLFTTDLLNVTKNRRTNPFLRKRCEVEFRQRYNKIPRGEKISLMKRAPLNLLEHFIDENDESILGIILDNPSCTEDLVIKMVNRGSDREKLYKELTGSRWLTNRRICFAISHDREVPIRIWMEIIPSLGVARLKEIAANEDLHENVRKQIIFFLMKREEKGQ